jgi:pyridoxamine 5'-phosphate oxidase family protein
MSVFTEAELEYMGGDRPPGDKGARRLARLATVGKDGTPHVVPVGFSYNADHDSIDIRGYTMFESKKYRDVRRSGRAAIVVDDLASIDPWRPRGIEVRGRAEAVGGDRPLIRIHPERIVPWGLEHESGARSVNGA